MKLGWSPDNGQRPGRPRVGLFGILGAGNLGNDASMESILGYLRREHPDAVLDAMSTASARLIEHYGIQTVDLKWRKSDKRRAKAIVRMGLAKSVEWLRIAAWVSRHEVVIVPGAGVLEASLPVRPWQMPCALFVVCVSGKLFRTKVALVSVGANPIDHRVTRWLSNVAARLAFYRSYRDSLSSEAMQQRGLDVSRDRVYTDMVFDLPSPPDDPGNPNHVAVGIMSYYGTNDDRRWADDLHVAYIEKMNRLVLWLLDNGRKVTLITGDSINDEDMAQQLICNIRSSRPELDPELLMADRSTSMQALMQAIQPVGMVIAIRYHNLIAALKLSKPSISIGYSHKHDVLMADVGLSDFCQSANSLDIDHLIEQFTELERRSSELRRTIKERTDAYVDLVQQQFKELSEVLFSGTGTEQLGQPGGRQRQLEAEASLG